MIGDRYRFYDGSVFEITIIKTNLCEMRCCVPSGTYLLNDESMDYPIEWLLSTSWKYLGNFSKSDNLTTLFDILSENRHPTSTLENI